MITARHAKVPQDELRPKRQVETCEYQQRSEPSPTFRIHSPCHFRPPEVNATQVCHQHAADHDVVEMGNDEVRVVEVDIQPKGRQKQPCKSADGEQCDENESVEHR